MSVCDKKRKAEFYILSHTILANTFFYILIVMLCRYMLPISSNRLLKYAPSVKWCMFSCFLFKLENLVFFSKLNRTIPYNNTICLGLCNDYFYVVYFVFVTIFLYTG